MKTKQIIIVFSLVVLLGLAYLIYYVLQEDKRFLKEGIEVEATITELFLQGKKRNPTYIMTISMFTAGESQVIKSDTTGKSKGDQAIDKIFDDIKSKQSSIGAFQMVNVNINQEIYDKYNVGDKIKVLYLKEDPENVKALEMLK